MNERFDKFTERARNVLTLAQEEATRFNHNYIGTEHLLLGLVREGEGVAARVLSNLGVELEQVRSAIEFIIGKGDRPAVGEIGLTPRAKKVIELAVDEARRLGHHYIGTEHVLLGLVREGEGIAAGVLESLGINLDRLRTQTIQVLSQSQTSHAHTARRAVDPEGAGTTATVESVQPPESIRRVRLDVERSRRLQPTRWEYRVAQVVHGAQGPLIGLIDGAEDRRLGLSGKPLHLALAILGADGWRLAAVDDGAARAEGPAAGASHYIFARPLADGSQGEQPTPPDTPAA